MKNSVRTNFFARETHETVWTKLWAERIYGIVNDFLNDFVTECPCDHVRSAESCDNRFIYPFPDLYLHCDSIIS